MKFDVQIFGIVPDCVEVEADTKDEAVEKALQKVLDILDFVAEESEPGSECPSTPEAKEKRKAD
jgi:hypothetical protein